MVALINLLMQFAVPIGVLLGIIALIAAFVALRRAEGDPLQDISATSAIRLVIRSGEILRNDL